MSIHAILIRAILYTYNKIKQILYITITVDNPYVFGLIPMLLEFTAVKKDNNKIADQRVTPQMLCVRIVRT
ncbi:hypothetical protein BDW42DRAFT_1955 [Aspergillus taichungensis]|uniref:Uncharacterized protein n=1 Tax=Aspergillus taichungensis TaxID=482145 RepID=A0A2J5I5Y4_9EURO|nr:hypothetical protein BDW42DRAFT_1955 [Aspergillus taichungensis]